MATVIQNNSCCCGCIVLQITHSKVTAIETDSETLNLVYDLGAGWCTPRLHVRVYIHVCVHGVPTGSSRRIVGINNCHNTY